MLMLRCRTARTRPASQNPRILIGEPRLSKDFFQILDARIEWQPQSRRLWRWWCLRHPQAALEAATRRAYRYDQRKHQCESHNEMILLFFRSLIPWAFVLVLPTSPRLRRNARGRPLVQSLCHCLYSVPGIPIYLSVLTAVALNPVPSGSEAISDSVLLGFLIAVACPTGLGTPKVSSN